MDKELQELDRVVAAISQRVNAIGENTGVTYQDLKQIEASVQASIETLDSMESSNRKLVQTLSNMKSLQAEINANLQAMNDKTRFLPETSVRTRLFRARQLLKEKLAAWMEGRNGK